MSEGPLTTIRLFSPQVCELRRAIDQDAGAGEVEDVVRIALERVVPAGQLDSPAGFDQGADADLMLRRDVDFGGSRCGPEIMVHGADVAAGLRVTDILDLAAGDQMALDLRVAPRVDLDDAAVFVRRELAAALDADADVGAGVRAFRRRNVPQVDPVLGRDVPARHQHLAEEGVDRANFIGGRRPR